MSLEPRASVRLIEDADGQMACRCMFSDVMFSVAPEAVSFTNGVLRIAIPTWIDVPYGVTVIEKWLPPTPEQVRLAVEALDPGLLETLLAREQVMADEPIGVSIRRVVGMAVAGARPGDD